MPKTDLRGPALKGLTLTALVATGAGGLAATSGGRGPLGETADAAARSGTGSVAAGELGRGVALPLRTSRSMDRIPLMPAGTLPQISAPEISETRDQIAAAMSDTERARQSVEAAAQIAAAELAQAKAEAEARAQALAQAMADPRGAARAMLADFGWGSGQFSCLNSLWNRESGWNLQATNSSSGAYGIPQALPGSKMASVDADWRSNPVTQIRWGLRYIQSSYGSPCSAWGHSQSYGWY